MPNPPDRMPLETLSAEVVEMLGLPTSFRSRLVGWRIDRASVIAYPQLADGTEGQPVDLVPLLAYMRRGE
jgi:hypothetical protein